MRSFLNNFIYQLSRTLNRFVLKLPNSSAFQLAITYGSLPYLLWQLLMPVIPLGKWADIVSILSRSLLEKQRSRHLMAFNIISLLVLATLIPFTQIQADSFPTSAQEITINVPDLEISTEETFQMPVPGYISQGYGWLHHGIDIAGNNGVAVYPITSGTVKEIAYSPLGYGLQVVIDHGNGIVSRYAHLQSKNVELNQKVTKQEVIGLVGSTGWSTGPHLHLEVYQNNRSINPFAYVPPKYSEEIKVIATNNTQIATQKITDTHNSASISAQIEYKEIAPDFTDPNWFSEASFSGINK